MPDLMTLTGVVATAPRHITTNSGLDITSFRLASGQRKFDKANNKWVDAETNWYTVTAFRQLALNLVTSLERGQHVLVSGRLRIRSWESGEKSGITIDLEADAVGHDLTFGTSVHTRVLNSPPGGGAPAGTEPEWPSSPVPSGEGAGDGESAESGVAAGGTLVPF